MSCQKVIKTNRKKLKQVKCVNIYQFKRRFLINELKILFTLLFTVMPIQQINFHDLNNRRKKKDLTIFEDHAEIKIFIIHKRKI